MSGARQITLYTVKGKVIAVLMAAQLAKLREGQKV